MTRLVYVAMAIAEIALAVPLLVRLVLGPTVCDRIVALNTITTQAVLAALFVAAATERVAYLDVTLWFASAGYLVTILWSRHLDRGPL